MSERSSPSIAIVGGGLGGVLLLRILHLHGVPNVTLYERDISLASRSHLGGTLDMHADSGQLALREAGLRDQFLRHARPEGQEMRIVNKAGEIIFVHDEQLEGFEARKTPITELGPESRPEVDRSILRRFIVESCPPESILWDHNLISAKSLPNGQTGLSFANGYTATCDLVIGAEGGRSRVRSLVSNVTSSFTGYTGAEVSLTPEVVAATPDVNKLVGPGTMLALDPGCSLMSQRNGDGRIRTYVWFKEEENFSLPTEAVVARKLLLSKYETWAPTLKKLIELCDLKGMYRRPLYALPVGHRWDHKKGITLIGDASHLMPPSGEGANLALLEGMELGLALALRLGKEGNGGDWDEAIVDFEKKMFDRAEEAATEAGKTIMSFLEDGTEGALKAFREIIPGMGS